jgi:DNA-binding transcriptional ArsR family regulator
MATTRSTTKRAKARKKDDVLDERIVKAISHPIRHRVLVLLNDRVASPNEIANEIGESLGRVSYHVRQLAEVGAIELVRTEPRRGAVEHFYRATARAWFSDSDWALLPKTTRRGIFGQNLKRIGADVVAAANSDGFDAVQAHVSFTLLELDDAGMGELSELLTETIERALQIHADAAARRAEANGSSGESHSTELAMLHFERPRKPARGAKKRS